MSGTTSAASGRVFRVALLWSLVAAAIRLCPGGAEGGQAGAGRRGPE